ncbi:unnamed protein product [Cunninghamella blakesleeana]
MVVNIHEQTVYNDNKKYIPRNSIGPPAKLHWKPDSESECCEYEGCATYFGIFERRHHCRRCGDIFCNQHCSNYFRLDQDCKFNNEGILCRGCDNCINEYNVWLKTNNHKSNSSSSSLSSSSSTSLPNTTTNSKVIIKENQQYLNTSSIIDKNNKKNHQHQNNHHNNNNNNNNNNRSVSPYQTESLSESSSTIDPSTFITSTRVQRNVSPKKSLLFKRHPNIVNQQNDSLLGKFDEASSSNNQNTKSISIDNSKNNRNKKLDYTPVDGSVPADWSWSTF